MSLLLLFRPSAGSGDANVSLDAGVLALVGGTHTLTTSGSVTGTPGTLALVGGTHTTALAGSVDATAGIIVLSGGTHQVDNGVANPNMERLKIGTGK